MKSSLTEALGQTVAEHEVRLDGLETSAERRAEETLAALVRIDKKVDALTYCILGLLGSSAGGLTLYVLSMTARK